MDLRHFTVHYQFRRNTIDIMGIITGYLSLILLLLVLAKYVCKRCNMEKANAFFMKIHKYVAFGFLLMSIIHFVLVLQVLDTRAIIITVSGIIIVVVGVVLTIVCHVIKDHKKEIHYHRFFSLLILIMTLVHIVFYFIDFGNYQSAINTITVDSVDLRTIEDGDYIGEYDVGYIYAKVKVTIKNHAIAQVELLEHNHERGVKAESIIDTMVTKQTIDVDTVSGATNSSLVIKKACENAIN